MYIQLTCASNSCSACISRLQVCCRIWKERMTKGRSPRQEKLTRKGLKKCWKMALLFDLEPQLSGGVSMPAKTTFHFLIFLSLDVFCLHATLSLFLAPFLLPFLLLRGPDEVFLLEPSLGVFWVQPRRQKPRAVTPSPGATLSVVVGSYFFL